MDETQKSGFSKAIYANDQIDAIHKLMVQQSPIVWTGEGLISSNLNPIYHRKIDNFGHSSPPFL